MNTTPRPAMKQMFKSGLVHGLWLMLGRERLVRLSRFLANESRLDVANDMARNGEALVHRVVLDRARDRAGTVIFDVGANIGDWTRTLCAAAGPATPLRVHAFEPCAGTRRSLTANLEAWGLGSSVVVNGVALSSSVGEAPFYSLGANAGRNGLHPTGDGAVHMLEKVPTETLDYYCRRRGLGTIHLLKIDTEGHDLEVLLGAKDLLSAGAIEMVQFEYNYRWVLARHYLRDAFELLQPLGYALGKVTPRGVEFYPGWDMELESFREANFVAVRPELAGRFPQIQWWKEPARFDF